MACLRRITAGFFYHFGTAATSIQSVDSGQTYCVWRNPETGLWSERIQVDINSVSTTPAMWIDQNGLYVHTVWSEPDGDGKMQVMYRRGQFVEG